MLIPVFYSSTVVPALSYWLLLRFLRSARIWVNCCSVVSIFIAFLKFRPTTYRTHPPFPAGVHLTFTRSVVYMTSTLPLFPLSTFAGHFIVDYQISLAVHIYQ